MKWFIDYWRRPITRMDVVLWMGVVPVLGITLLLLWFGR